MTAIDNYRAGSSSILAPFRDAAAITTSDATDLAEVTRGIMVTTAGDVSVIMESGVTVTLPALQPGTIYPVRVKRVRTTGTATTTGIVGLY